MTHCAYPEPIAATPNHLPQEQERYAAELEHNRGVHLHLSLQAVPIEASVAASKGIKRWRDKLVLPASAQHRLLEQDASKNGAMLFEVTVPSGARTHAGRCVVIGREGEVYMSCGCLGLSSITMAW